MRHVVEKGKTLLVDGPASIGLLSGRVSVLHAQVRVGEKIIIREGKRVPFGVKKTAAFDMMLGEGACFEEITQDPVPSSWEDASKEMLSLRRPLRY